jgi:hypothetical protein
MGCAQLGQRGGERIERGVFVSHMVVAPGPERDDSSRIRPASALLFERDLHEPAFRPLGRFRQFSFRITPGKAIAALRSDLISVGATSAAEKGLARRD